MASVIVALGVPQEESGSGVCLTTFIVSQKQGRAG